MMPKDFDKFNIDDKVKERVYTFEDGSRIKISLTPAQIIKNAPNPNINVSKSILSPNIVIGDSFGTLYKNYTVRKDVGTTYAYFTANFYVARYGTSEIYTPANSNNLYNAPYGEGAAGFGLTSNPSKELIRDKEYNGNAALFRLYWFNQVTVGGSWAGVSGNAPVGSTCNLYLALVNQSMYVASTLPSSW